MNWVRAWYYSPVDREILDSIRTWFESYAVPFVVSGDAECRDLFRLKLEHTRRVAEYCLSISAALELGPERSMLAQATGILHDVGRFPQYRDFRTFRDSVSVNHALLGIEVINEHRVLDRLAPAERECITTAIRYHNVFLTPEIEDPGPDLFVRLIRDADKLDIWNVLAGFYETPEDERSPSVGNDLPEGEGYSGEAVRHIMDGRAVMLSRMENLNDLKLLNLSWVYDLNFATSFRQLISDGSLGRIAACLPQTDEILGMIETLNAYIKRKALES